MINNSINTVLFLVLTFYLNITLQAQITRGEGEGELYISSDWYMDNNGQVHYAILHTTDNGEHITLQYENIETPPPDEMQAGKVLGDATPGALYNYGNNKLWVSFDFGESWEFREDYPDNTYYLSGIFGGIIYNTSWIKLHKSEDFGQSFEIITDPLTIPIPAIGFSDGEFHGINGDAGIGFTFVHTTDYANTYSEIPIDSAVAFWSIGGYWPKLTRGTEPGEIYLVSWWLDSNYKIFHSTDTGYTWTEKFESETIDIYYWRVKYTAGREPGSFYVLRSRINPAGSHVWLNIDYSSDYGETFTTYFHDLDSTITSIMPGYLAKPPLSNYPNPFNNTTTIRFDLPKNTHNPILNIYDIYGKVVKKYNINGKDSQQWDGKDKKGNIVSKGVYLYNINYVGYVSTIKKMLYL